MNRTGHKNASFFIGPEVEHTPAFSKKTLFVVGKQKLEDIEAHAKAAKAPHIFLGANHSFFVDKNDSTLYWDQTITALLDKGYWVTLDYQAHEHESVLKMLNAGIWQSRLFVPLLGVRIANIETSNPNLTVKIDDVDFAATNRGVWCMHFHEVTDSNRFTDWTEYSSDEVIGAEPTVAVAAPAVVATAATVAVEVATDVKNDASIGLDTTSGSMLKMDESEAEAVNSVLPGTAEDAAELYAAANSAEETTTKKAPKAKK